MLIALFTAMAVDAAHAADGLPDSGAQTGLTAEQKMQDLIDAGVLCPLSDGTPTQEEKITRADWATTIVALLESGPPTGLPPAALTSKSSGANTPIC
jgi:hypothetical protein